MPKKVEVIPGVTLQFLQHASGEETPYMAGNILAGRNNVGSFNNSGRGGITIVHVTSDAIRETIKQSAKTCRETAGIPDEEMRCAFDPMEMLVDYGEYVTYTLKVTPEQYTLQDYYDSMLSMFDINGRMTEAQRARYSAAKQKDERIGIQQIAAKQAKKGKTLVRIGNNHFTYNGRDFDRIKTSILKDDPKSDFEIFAGD